MLDYKFKRFTFNIKLMCTANVIKSYLCDYYFEYKSENNENSVDRLWKNGQGT